MSDRRTRRNAGSLQVGRCPACGKRRYPSRTDARKAIRRAHPGERMQAYRCEGFWHIGHLPHGVRRGEARAA